MLKLRITIFCAWFIGRRSVFISGKILIKLWISVTGSDLPYHVGIQRITVVDTPWLVKTSPKCTGNAIEGLWITFTSAIIHCLLQSFSQSKDWFPCFKDKQHQNVFNNQLHVHSHTVFWQCMSLNAYVLFFLALQLSFGQFVLLDS